MTDADLKSREITQARGGTVVAGGSSAGLNKGPWDLLPPFFGTGFLVLGLSAGTGGAMSAPALAAATLGSATNPNVGQIERLVGKKRSEDYLSDTAEQLVFVQQQFSLNRSDLSQVLRVSRPTVYAWLREESQPQADNIQRVRELFGFARLWRNMSTHPVGRMVRRPLHNGQALFGLLSADVLDETAVRRSLAQVCRAVQSREGEVHRPRKPLTEEMAERFGLAEPSERERQSSIEDEIGI